jgi:parallel beta-helix repeat protein
MKCYHKILFILSILLIFPNIVSAYEKHEPILIENIKATPDNPYIIEGYEISSSTANCIEVRNSDNVIIRNNYLHHCNWSKKEGFDKSKGFAILIKDSENIVVEKNVLEDNKQGMTALNSENIDVLYNNISKTILCNSLTCERCQDGEIKGNNLFDNGVSEWFWAPGYRIMAINLIRSSDFDIHENTIVRSSSDGMLIIGMIYGGSLTSEIDDWTGITENIRIFNNIVLDNMEIGIVASRARNIEILNNTVRGGCFTPTGVVVFDVDVRNSKMYNNKLLPCSTPRPIAIGMSKDNEIYNNIFYSVEKDSILETIDFIGYDVDKSGNMIKAEWSGIEYYESHDNVEWNNTKKSITGKLAEEMLQKIELAEAENTFSQKGWFSCEVKEGVIDKECVEKERQKGNQGIPREYLPYKSLIHDFENFVTNEPEDIKKENSEKEILHIDEKNDEKDFNKPERIIIEECDYTMEKVYAYLFFITFSILILISIFYIRKRS